MHRFGCLVVIGTLAVAVSGVAAGPAVAAKGGNNDAAKVCQKGGWKTLVPHTDGTFANQGDCVNDGAHGSPPFGTAGNAACNAIGGQFDLRTKAWTCLYTPNSTGSDTAALRTACATDGGGTFSTEDDPPLGQLAICPQ
jgi:hypothetical protein